MGQVSEIEYIDLEKNDEWELIINKVLEKCFKTECLEKTDLYISIILTTPENIRKYKVGRSKRNSQNITKEICY